MGSMSPLHGLSQGIQRHGMSLWILRNRPRAYHLKLCMPPLRRLLYKASRWHSESIGPGPNISVEPLPKVLKDTQPKASEPRGSCHKDPGSPGVTQHTDPTCADYDDAKLRQIIETSNMSAARQIERERQEKLKIDIEAEKREVEDRRDSKVETKTTAPDTPGFNAEPTHAKIPKANLPSSQIDPESPENRTVSTNVYRAGRAMKETWSQTCSANRTKKIDLESLRRKSCEKIALQRVNFDKWKQKKWVWAQELLRLAAVSLNDTTGYSGIEKHKLLVEQVEQEIQQARESVKRAKVNYESAIQSRSDLQKEINELLTRKHTWSPVDVERFTELYKNDHRNQHDEEHSKVLLDEAEQHVDALQTKLTALILTRYHEEQLWSDKIRQALTWGTWMLMGVNIMLFATATFFVEPWKRRKLVTAFQNEVQLKMEEYSAELKSLSNRLSSEAADLEEHNAQKHGTSILPESVSLPNIDENHHQISFAGIDSWTSLKSWATALVTAVKAPGAMTFSMETPDFAILSGLLVAFGWIFGSLFNAVIFRK